MYSASLSTHFTAFSLSYTSVPNEASSERTQEERADDRRRSAPQDARRAALIVCENVGAACSGHHDDVLGLAAHVAEFRDEEVPAVEARDSSDCYSCGRKPSKPCHLARKNYPEPCDVFCAKFFEVMCSTVVI